MKKKILAFLLALTLGASAMTVQAAGTSSPATPAAVQSNVAAVKIGSSTAFINNKKTMIDANNKKVVPIKISGKTMLPLRFCATSMGGTCKYISDKDYITVKVGGKTAMFKIKSKEMRIVDNNGNLLQKVQLDVPATKVNTRVMVPVRAISQGLGSTVFYQKIGKEEFVLISTKALTAQQKADQIALFTGNTVTIGVLVFRFDDTYISTIRTALEKYAAKAGVEVVLDMRDARGDQARQNDQLDALCKKKVNALLINAVDASLAQGLATKAKSAGIPAIFFNREPSKKVIQSANGLYVGTDINAPGKMQGDLLAKLWASGTRFDLNGDGKCQYLIFKGEPGNPEAEARTKYCVDQAVAKGMSMDSLVKNPVVANWDVAQAQIKMEAYIASHRDKIEAVFCNNDDMALGVIAALNEAGYNKGDMNKGKWIPVLGIDATDAGVAEVKAGKMYATVKQDADAMGKALIAVGINAAQKKPSPFLQDTGYKLAGDGFSIRIPYVAVTK